MELSLNTFSSVSLYFCYSIDIVKIKFFSIFTCLFSGSENIARLPELITNIHRLVMKF